MSSRPAPLPRGPWLCVGATVHFEIQLPASPPCTIPYPQPGVEEVCPLTDMLHEDSGSLLGWMDTWVAPHKWGDRWRQVGASRGQVSMA